MENKFSRILGERLIRISDVSKATGLSRTTLTNFYYRRNKNVSYETLEKLCDYLNVSLSELLEYYPVTKKLTPPASNESVRK